MAVTQEHNKTHVRHHLSEEEKRILASQAALQGQTLEEFVTAALREKIARTSVESRRKG